MYEKVMFILQRLKTCFEFIMFVLNKKMLHSGDKKLIRSDKSDIDFFLFRIDVLGFIEVLKFPLPI